MTAKKPSKEIVTRPLREVSAEFLQLANAVEAEAFENEGVISEELNDRLDAITGELTVKLDQCAIVREAFTAHRDRLRQEVARLEQIADAHDNAAKRVHELMLFQMQRSGVKRCDTEHFKLWTVGTAKSVQITNEDDVPDEYKTVTVTVKCSVRDSETVLELLEKASQPAELHALHDGYDAVQTVRIDKIGIRNTYKAMEADKVEGEIPGARMAAGKTILKVK